MVINHTAFCLRINITSSPHPQIRFYGYKSPDTERDYLFAGKETGQLIHRLIEMDNP